MVNVLSVFSLELQILITPVGIFKPLVNVFSVLPSVTDSNYPCGAFKLLVNVLSVLPLVTKSNYPCGVFKLFYLFCSSIVINTVIVTAGTGTVMKG